MIAGKCIVNHRCRAGSAIAAGPAEIAAARRMAADEIASRAVNLLCTRTGVGPAERGAAGRC